MIGTENRKKVTVISISPLHIEIEQSETEWLHDRLQANINREAVQGIWKEKEKD